MATNNLTGTDSYLPLNKIAMIYGKRVDNWTRLESTKALVKAFQANPKYSGMKPYEDYPARSVGGQFADGQGLVAHPDVAVEFERWCQKPSRSEPECVYLIWAIGSDMFKIGIARDPSSRLKNLQVGSPLKLAISRIYFCSNPADMEVKLHSRFKKYHSHGEWFEVKSATAIALFDRVTKTQSPLE